MAELAVAAAVGQGGSASGQLALKPTRGVSSSARHTPQLPPLSHCVSSWHVGGACGGGGGGVAGGSGGGRGGRGEQGGSGGAAGGGMLGGQRGGRGGVGGSAGGGGEGLTRSQ